ncbi:MAG: aatB [Blastococcus sp.]|jgi:aspartate aminotransferase|nr:aatB [Blastococcus sp.]
MTQTQQLIRLDIGAPAFETPEHVKEAAIQAIREGQTHYTEVSGTQELKKAIREKLARENGLRYTDDQVTAAAGAKPVIMAVLFAGLEAGDEVVIPTPTYPAYGHIAAMAGARSVTVPADAAAGYKISPDDLRRALSPRTRWLLLNNPVNPTGALYSRSELAALASVLEGTSVRVLSDELYEHAVFEGEAVSFAALSPDAYARTVTVNGVSKTYAMTGWRLGYAAGDAGLIAAANAVLLKLLTCPPSISQAAAIAAMSGDQSMVADRREVLRSRRDRARAALDAMPGVSCPVPSAGLYVFPFVGDLLAASTGDVRTSQQLSAHLREVWGVAVAPGENFGAPGHLRITFAVSDEALTDGLTRMTQAFFELAGARA